MGEMKNPSRRRITIAIMALGGQGGGVLADWIIDMASRENYVAQGTSVPGVAQRTGATIYYIELFPNADRSPILALSPCRAMSTSSSPPSSWKPDAPFCAASWTRIAPR